MLFSTKTVQLVGLGAQIVEIEVDLARGAHSFSIVGLADKAVEEARSRIVAALKNSGFPPPDKGNKKIVVSLAPANIRKEGAGFDVAIALGLLGASQDIKFEARDKIFIGELALDGRVRPLHGILPLIQKAYTAGFREAYVPVENAREAALVAGIVVYPCRHLREIADHLAAEEVEGEAGNVSPLVPQAVTEITHQDVTPAIDFADIRGQEGAKRGLEIAAAGGHNVAMSGPPGTGKTLLAKALAGLLPSLSLEEAVEVTAIHSVAGQNNQDIITTPPFRAPHHTASYVSVVGGGTFPKPGEITLAHRGVLFLDEFPEFDKRVIESLRQPLEDRIVSVSRARGSVQFPAGVILVAAMNPCPCGYYRSGLRDCRCSAADILRYQKKLSGPIIDRIDVWLEVPHLPPEALAEKHGVREESAEVKKRISAARARQTQRFAGLSGVRLNNDMSIKEIVRFADLDPQSGKILNDAARRMGLSARAYHRVLKLARTIADLGGEENILENHLLEALQYRPRIGV